MASPGRSASLSITECLVRLEALLTSGPPWYLPSRRAPWDEEVRSVLHRLREALSADAKRAAGGAEAETILRRAQDEARRIVLEAEDHARRALEDGTLARAAEQQIQQLREQAVREADETRRGADMSALSVLAYVVRWRRAGQHRRTAGSSRRHPHGGVLRVGRAPRRRCHAPPACDRGARAREHRAERLPDRAAADAAPPPLRGVSRRVRAAAGVRRRGRVPAGSAALSRGGRGRARTRFRRFCGPGRTRRHPRSHGGRARASGAGAADRPALPRRV